MAILTLARGLPGSGKSTYAQRLGCLHLEDDMFRVTDGKYRFDWKEADQPQRVCRMLTMMILALGRDVAVSNPFVTLEELEEYIRMAQDQRATLRVVKCVGRWAPRHRVEQQVVDIMRAQWEDYEGEEVWSG